MKLTVESSEIFYESFQIQYKHSMCIQYYNIYLLYNLPEIKKNIYSITTSLHDKIMHYKSPKCQNLISIIKYVVSHRVIRLELFIPHCVKQEVIIYTAKYF